MKPTIIAHAVCRRSRHGVFLQALLCALALAPLGLDAQQYPVRPVRFIVGFPPGAAVDSVARMFGETLAVKWGQPVFVENRPGATGNIGTEAVARAEPDGYTLLFTVPPFVINPFLYPKLPFEASQFVPVTVIATFPNILVVHPRVGARSVRDLIVLAQENPDRLNYASPGAGSTPHLTAEMFKSMAGGLKITHVPYKGGGPQHTAMLAGEVEMMFANPESVLSQVRAGRLRALAVASERRFASLPDIPTMSETLPGFVSVTWWGVLAPPKTPMHIAEKLSAEIAWSLKQPKIAKHLADISVDPVGSTPAEMAGFLKQEAERWSGIIRAAAVKLD
jgi:tripartite-type tricarboxylate transporter receptor subunit TctC